MQLYQEVIQLRDEYFSKVESGLSPGHLQMYRDKFSYLHSRLIDEIKEVRREKEYLGDLKETVRATLMERVVKNSDTKLSVAEQQKKAAADKDYVKFLEKKADAAAKWEELKFRITDVNIAINSIASAISLSNA